MGNQHPSSNGKKHPHQHNNNQKRKEEQIDRIDEDSFPASDPPPWSGGHPGAPRREKKDKR